MYLQCLESRVFLSGNGLRGEYFSDANLTYSVFTRTDPTVNFNFGSLGALSEVPSDHFSTRWTGQIQATVTGTYAFRTLADDGVRLFIRGQSLIDRWSTALGGDTNGDGVVNIADLGTLASNYGISNATFANGDFNGDGKVDIADLGILATNYGQSAQPVSNTATISLTAGQKYDIKLEYYDNTGPASVQLLWTPPGGSEQVVPRENLFDTYSAAPATVTNPIAPTGADPWVIQYQGEYIYCFSDGGRVFVSRSPRLQDIGSATPKLVWQPPANKPYSQDVWAPELHYLRGQWYIYVAADDGNNADHHMYVLQGNSQDPLGSYTFKGQLAATTDRWAIDGTAFEFNNSLYFVWSGWPGSTDGQQNLYIASMSDPMTISGDRQLLSTPTYSWEQSGLPINEGPEALIHNGTLNIIYSASGYWTNDYCLGQLTYSGSGSLLLGAHWAKNPTPVFAQDSVAVGVGHASFTQSPDGLEDWIVYHAHNTTGDFTGTRDIRIQPFTWNTNNTPNFGSPVLSVTEPGGTPHFTSGSALPQLLNDTLPLDAVDALVQAE